MVDEFDKYSRLSKSIPEEAVTAVAESDSPLKLADTVSNSSINNIINLGLKNGAVGAKILGAGDGGFILFLSDRKNISKLKKKFSNKLSLELKFESTGSQIIYYSENE